MELLIGCGNSRIKKIKPGWRPPEWTRLVTLDIDPNCGADVVADLEDGLPFPDSSFDEVHAYEVLEHLGTQGDYRAFFRHFGELFRVLKHGGVLCGTTPKWDNRWAWGDPGHRRVISPDTLMFLAQSAYRECDRHETSRTDYRWLWKGDLRLVWMEDHSDSHCWALEAIKTTGGSPAEGQ